MHKVTFATHHSCVSSNFVDIIILTSCVYPIAWELWQTLAWHTCNSFQADNIPFKSNSREPHYEGIAGDHFGTTLAFWCCNANFLRSHIGFCRVLTYRKVQCATFFKIWTDLCPTCLSPIIIELQTNAHKSVNSIAPKSDPKWCETWPFRPITSSYLSLHPCRPTTFTISHFGSTRITLSLV